MNANICRVKTSEICRVLWRLCWPLVSLVVKAARVLYRAGHWELWSLSCQPGWHCVPGHHSMSQICRSLGRMNPLYGALKGSPLSFPEGGLLLAEELPLGTKQRQPQGTGWYRHKEAVLLFFVWLFSDFFFFFFWFHCFAEVFLIGLLSSPRAVFVVNSCLIADLCGGTKARSSTLPFWPIITESLSVLNWKNTVEKTEVWGHSAKLFSASRSGNLIEPGWQLLIPASGWGEVNKLHLISAEGGGTKEHCDKWGSLRKTFWFNTGSFVYLETLNLEKANSLLGLSFFIYKMERNNIL